MGDIAYEYFGVISLIDNVSDIWVSVAVALDLDVIVVFEVSC